jgi:hypothetical protein
VRGVEVRRAHEWITLMMVNEIIDLRMVLKERLDGSMGCR